MIDFRDGCAELSRIIAQVTDDDLSLPTPCTDLDVAGLLRHVEEFATGFTEAAGSSPTGPGVDDVRGDGRRARIAAHVTDLGGAWATPQPWAGTGDQGGLALPNETWGRIALTEVIVHGWDLAVAIGARYRPPSELVQACHDHVAAFVPNAPIPALWGDRVVVGENDLLESTVAITGRDPVPWRGSPDG